MDILKEKMQAFKKGKNKSFLLLLVGIVGILIIGISSCGGEKDKSDVIATPFDDNEYCHRIEEKISTLVSAITGDKNCVVAVTLEDGGEYVYADQNRVDTDQSEDVGEGGTTLRETQKTEQEYIIVQGENGGQTALIVTEKKPCVRGVAIVAKGIDGIAGEQVLSSVSAMLGIPDRKISISSKAE